MFKEIEAKFKVVKDEAYEKGFYLDRNEWEFLVKRYKSGAFRYGDLSAHSINILPPSKEFVQPQYYDTRYDGISVEKDKWVEFWKKHIEDEWQVKLELLDYEERQVE